MAEDSAKQGTFTVEERAAMKEYAKEARAAAKRAKEEDAAAADLQGVVDAIAKFVEPDRTIAARVHELVLETAPELAARTWYGMPAYANKEGRVVCFFQNASKFKVRYNTLGFQQDANLDDGPMWPTSYAILSLTPAVEDQIRALVARAVS